MQRYGNNSVNGKKNSVNKKIEAPEKGAPNSPDYPQTKAEVVFKDMREFDKVKTESVFLDTLGQLPLAATSAGFSVSSKSTISEPKTTKKEPIIAKMGALEKRARSKWYSEQIVGFLLNDLGYISELDKYYERASNCCRHMKQEGQQMKVNFEHVDANGKRDSGYCRTRVCNICNRIRTAELMNGYVGQFKTRTGKEFVTLTLPSIPANELREALQFIIKTCGNIFRTINKNGIRISGIRAIETTHNLTTDMYHPHVHLIVDNNGGAEIRNEWIKRVPACWPVAQNVVEADDFSFNELFKYTTKQFTGAKDDEDVMYKGEFAYTNKGKRYPTTVIMCARVLDNIFCAMKGLRRHQPFGDIKKADKELTEEENAKSEIEEEDEIFNDLETQQYEDLPNREDNPDWYWDGHDWRSVKVDEDTGEVISDEWLTGVKKLPTKFINKDKTTSGEEIKRLKKIDPLTEKKELINEI